MVTCQSRLSSYGLGYSHDTMPYGPSKYAFLFKLLSVGFAQLGVTTINSARNSYNNYMHILYECVKILRWMIRYLDLIPHEVHSIIRNPDHYLSSRRLAPIPS
jgi:hypothetical protein